MDSQSATGPGRRNRYALPQVCPHLTGGKWSIDNRAGMVSGEVLTVATARQLERRLQYQVTPQGHHTPYPVLFTASGKACVRHFGENLHSNCALSEA